MLTSIESVNGPDGRLVFVLCNYLDLAGQNSYITGDQLQFVDLQSKVDGLKIVNVTALNFNGDDFKNESFHNLTAKYSLDVQCDKSKYKIENSDGQALLEADLSDLLRAGNGDYENKITAYEVIETNEHSFLICFKLAEENVGIHSYTKINLLESPFRSTFWDKLMNRIISEGVCYSYNKIPEKLRDSLKKNIDELASKTPVDYHPNSNEIVRDLVHPALYPYIKGVSKFKKDCTPPENCGGETKEDFWGRPYEDSKFQWLPTPFQISDDGKCTVKEYINNLDENKFSSLYKDLEDLFELFLPYFEEVWNYITSIEFFKNVDDDDKDDDNDDDDYDWDIDYPYKFDNDATIEDFDADVKVPEKYLVYEKVKREEKVLHGRELQVIVKIVDYTLQPGQEYEGVWHAEGMSHENIVMTGIYFIDRDVCLDGGDLKFKRAFTKKERNAMLFSVLQSRPFAFNKFFKEGFVPLGHFPTEEGYMLVFPNCHIHKIGKLINKASNKTSSRKIIVFFVINPDRKIISTREIAPQQDIISLKQAKEYRLELMAERKYDKEKLNIRDIELCEH